MQLVDEEGGLYPVNLDRMRDGQRIPRYNVKASLNVEELACQDVAEKVLPCFSDVQRVVLIQEDSASEIFGYVEGEDALGTVSVNTDRSGNRYPYIVYLEMGSRDQVGSYGFEAFQQAYEGFDADGLYDGYKK